MQNRYDGSRERYPGSQAFTGATMSRIKHEATDV